MVKQKRTFYISEIKSLSADTSSNKRASLKIRIAKKRRVIRGKHKTIRSCRELKQIPRVGKRRLSLPKRVPTKTPMRSDRGEKRLEIENFDNTSNIQARSNDKEVTVKENNTHSRDVIVDQNMEVKPRRSSRFRNKNSCM